MTVIVDMTRGYQAVQEDEAEVPVRTTSCQWAVRALMLLAWIFMITLNALTGPKIGATSNEYPTRITPAGYAFMIWTPIFIATLVFVIYAFVNRGPSNSLPPLAVVAFILNGIFNGLWGYVFTNKMGVLSVIVISGVLITNLVLYSIVFPKGASAFPARTCNYWCRQFVWSLYTGWMVVATLVNVEWAQQYYGVFISDKDQNIEGIVFIALAILVGLYWTLVREDIVAVSVLLWSFIAIAVQQTQYRCIFTAAVASSGIAFSFILLTVIRRVIGRV